MKTVFACLLVLGCCMNVYAGCPNGICNLKKSQAVSEAYMISPTTSTKATTTATNNTTKKRYRVSKWR